MHRGGCDYLLIGIKGMGMFLLSRLLVAVAEIQFKEDRIALLLTFYWIALSENDSFGPIVNI